MGIKKDGKDYTLETGKGTYPLRMTFKSLDYLDDIYKLKDEESGIDFGYGVKFLIAEITMLNLNAILHMIRSATLHLASKPSEESIIDMIGDMTDKEYDALFTVAQDFLSEAALTKHAAKSFKATAKKATEKSTKKKAATEKEA